VLNQVKEDRTVRNWEASRSLGLPRCIVKLPAITELWSVIAVTEKNWIDEERQRKVYKQSTISRM